MNWRVFTTDDDDRVERLHAEILEAPLDVAKIGARQRAGERLHAFLVGRKGEPAAGFALCLGAGTRVELLSAGVLERARRRGAGRELIEGIARELAAAGHTAMDVFVPSARTAMLKLLLDRGYHIVGVEQRAGDDLEVHLQRTLRARKELRYALTERCNFRCIFCHNEGLARDAEREDLPAAEILAVLSAAVEQGCTDITFTGGEPLLARKKLLEIIAGLGRFDSPPALTIVTNGSRLDHGVIEALARYPGQQKLNISLHAADARTFQKITHSRRTKYFDEIRFWVNVAADRGVVVKVNHVVLRGYNHEKILDAVELARRLGARTIKLLELLVVDRNSQDFAWYYDANAIAHAVRRIATETESDLRTRRFVHDADPRFHIEVQKCTCAVGCSRCREVRDYQLSSDLFYHPCFVRRDAVFRMRDPARISETLADGDRILEAYAARYGDSSPTLVLREEYVPSKREFFFHVDSAEPFGAFLRESGFAITGATRFHEEYFQPRGAGREWTSFRRVLKLGVDSHDDSKVDLIYTDHEYHEHDDVGYETATRFLFPTGPLRLPTIEDGRRMLDRFDFEKVFELDWDLQVWSSGKLALNLAPRAGATTVKVMGSKEDLAPYLEIFESYGGRIEPLREPLVAFVSRNAEPRTGPDLEAAPGHGPPGPPRHRG